MAKKVAYLGIMTALAMVLGWLESLVPVVVFAPGIKLGIANVVTLFVLYRFGWKEAAVISLLRVFLISLLFGNFSVFLYSVAGAIFSLLTMALLKHSHKFSIMAVSAVGGVMHNLGQLCMAIFLVRSIVLGYYFPVILLSGVIAGILVGLLGAYLHKKIPENIQ